MLLVFRLVLKALGANAYVGFTSLIYVVTEPLAAPFKGMFGVTTGSNTIEWSTIIAAIVYLLNIINPITPSDVD